MAAKAYAEKPGAQALAKQCYKRGQSTRPSTVRAREHKAMQVLAATIAAPVASDVRCDLKDRPCQMASATEAWGYINPAHYANPCSIARTIQYHVTHALFSGSKDGAKTSPLQQAVELVDLLNGAADPVVAAAVVECVGKFADTLATRRLFCPPPVSR